MDPNSDKEKSELRLKWRKLAAGLRQQEKVSEMLEDVEAYLIRLEQEMTQSGADPKKSDLYLQLKQKKHELDQILDEIESITAEDVQNAQDQYVKAILSKNPHLNQAYEALNSALNDSLKKERQSIKLVDGLSLLLDKLNSLIAIRSKTKGSGIIRYLFGTTPTQSITDIIRDLQHLVNEMVKNDQGEDINLLLKQIKGLGNQRWDFGLIDNHYGPIRDSVEIFLNRHRTNLEVVRQQKLGVRDQLREWIDKADS